MKYLLTLIICLFPFFIAHAQQRTGIVSKSSKPKAGEENIYYYLPPKGLQLPQEMQVLVTYEVKDVFYKKKIPLRKNWGSYLFSFKVPDSTGVLIFSVINAKRKVLKANSLIVEKEVVVDNNRDQGFVMYLYNSKGLKYDFCNISLANLLHSFAIYAHQLKTVSQKDIIGMYETGFKHQSNTNNISYVNYLVALYEENADKGRHRLLGYAKQLETYDYDETNLLTVRDIYTRLDNDTLKKSIESKILNKFPTGRLAQENFWDTLNSQKEYSEELLLSSMLHYMQRFNDSSLQLKDKFYKLIISHFINSRQYGKLAAYEELIQDKFFIIFRYNYEAWKLAGKGLDNPGSNLADAKSLSSKAIKHINSLLEIGKLENEDGDDLYAVQDMNINTYALILYKNGEYDSAFFYQYPIYQKSREFLDDAGYERLATYIEKSKGIDSAKRFIEYQLLRGLISQKLLNQLELIYQQLDIPFNEFKQVMNKGNKLLKLKRAALIKRQMGSVVAKGFVLKNNSGDKISLSSYRNKIIVLDFWATWCSPCKASFPAMQKLVNKYNADTNIVFLFIDVWERDPYLKNVEKVTAFLLENKYNFNVLFDEQNKTAAAYKLTAIPKKFIINRKGEIFFISDGINYLDDISLEIEAAKELPL
jgi:thiol-disulfide isomerase/thioredoxin